jgi:thioredoxin-like negative regulator of GroEL
MGMVYKGRVAVRRALAAKDNAAVAQARSWFRRAARGHQESALPFMLYYDSFTAIGQTPPADAVAGIYQAVALVPQDSSLRVRAALELLRAGQVADARAIIAPVAFEAEGSGENSALKLVREMNATKDPQMLLAKARELKLDQINDFTDPPKEDKDKDKA